VQGAVGVHVELPHLVFEVMNLVEPAVDPGDHSLFPDSVGI
jgi:hypothetical protein